MNNPARRRIDGGKVMECRYGMGNPCGRREADGAGGEGAGCYSRPNDGQLHASS
jgi:hypothetical protein